MRAAGTPVSFTDRGTLEEGTFVAGDIDPASGVATMEELIEAMEAGNAYVNVHTTKPRVGRTLRGRPLLSPALAEVFDVCEVTGPPHDPLVPDELVPAQHGDFQSFDLHDDAILRGLFEVHAADGSQDIDSLWRQTDLEDHVRAGKIFERKLVKGSAEGLERAPDAMGIIARGPYPEVQIPGCARHAVRGERMRADDDVFSSLREQRGQHLDEVAIQGRLLP